MHISAQTPLQKSIFSTGGQNLHKSSCQTFLVLPNFACFSHFLPNILSRIVVASIQNLKCLLILCFRVFQVKSRKRYASHWDVNHMLYQGCLILKGTPSLDVSIVKFCDFLYYSSIFIETELEMDFTVYKIINFY